MRKTKIVVLKTFLWTFQPLWILSMIHFMIHVQENQILNMRPVTKCVCVFATSGTAIVDSGVTFTGMRTTTEVNVSRHVSLNTSRCTGQIVGTWPPACPWRSAIMPISLLDLEVTAGIRVDVKVATNSLASWFNIANTLQTLLWDNTGWEWARVRGWGQATSSMGPSRAHTALVVTIMAG